MLSKESPLIVTADNYNGRRVLVDLQRDATELQCEQYNKALFEYMSRSYVLVENSKDTKSSAYEFRTQEELQTLVQEIKKSGLPGADDITAKISHLPTKQQLSRIKYFFDKESPFVIMKDTNHYYRSIVIDLLPEATEWQRIEFASAILVYAANGNKVINNGCNPEEPGYEFRFQKELNAFADQMAKVDSHAAEIIQSHADYLPPGERSAAIRNQQSNVNQRR